MTGIDTLTVKLGTRGSPLALAQARIIEAMLEDAGRGQIKCEIVPITTSGDRIQDRRLIEAGGKGLFTKELDLALDDGDVDLLVHSLKDVPTILPYGQELLIFPKREDPREAFISNTCTHPNDLPRGARVGTASLRRQAQTSRLRRDVEIVNLRGNVGTRLSKIDAGEADATYLAMAGLNRLGKSDVAAGVIPIEDMLPAVGQGIVTVAGKPSELHPLVLRVCHDLDHAETRLAALAERAFLRALDGSCRTAIAAHFWRGAWGQYRMRGEVYHPEGTAVWCAAGRIHKGETGIQPTQSDVVGLGLNLANVIKTAAGDALPKLEADG